MTPQEFEKRTEQCEILMEKCAPLFGEREQMLQTIEELAELIMALCKSYRVFYGGQPTSMTKEECADSIIEEIADVEVVLHEYKYLHMISDDVTLPIKESKVDRALFRFKEAYNEKDNSGD